MKAEKYFLKGSKQIRLYTKSFQSIASLSRKAVSPYSHKNLQKNEKCKFQRLRIFVFDLKVTSKLFSEKNSFTKFWFEQFLKLCLSFPENGFNFVNQKIAKKWKMLFWKVRNIRFWPKCIFKSIFLNAFYEQLWI